MEMPRRVQAPFGSFPELYSFVTLRLLRRFSTSRPQLVRHKGQNPSSRNATLRQILVHGSVLLRSSALSATA
jgi:hypothetical protein